MDKFEVRAVIKFFYLEGKTASEIKNKMDGVLGDNSPSFSTISFWVSEFKRGRTDIRDESRSGRPKTATTPKFVAQVKEMVQQDRRVKVREIGEAIGISSERVLHILKEQLGMRKMCARWVPHLLNDKQKERREELSRSNLELLTKNKSDFMRRFITMDETWIHHYTPETKTQSKQWIGAGEACPRKAKSIQSAGKVMASVFWDAKGILLVDYLAKGKTVTGQYYTTLLDMLKSIISKKQPGMTKKKVLFHHDNAPAHSSAIVQQKLAELRFQLVPHPPYSPDLAPSDFHLFPKLKIFLAGTKFHSNEEAICAVNAYFEGLEENHFREGIEKLEKRWTKCVELRGDFVEK